MGVIRTVDSAWEVATWGAASFVGDVVTGMLRDASTDAIPGATTDGLVSDGSYPSIVCIASARAVPPVGRVPNHSGFPPCHPWQFSQSSRGAPQND
jgi:hypothetical protein